MKDNLVEEYRYLWDGTDPSWVLLKEPDLHGGLCVYSIDRQALLHIEDEELNATVCRRMKEAGIKIIDDFPSSDVQIRPID